MADRKQDDLGSIRVTVVAAALLASCSSGAGRAVNGGAPGSHGGTGGTHAVADAGTFGGGDVAGSGGIGGGSIVTPDAAAPHIDAAAAGDDAGTAPSPDAGQPPREGWVFVSIPDWMNNDVAYRDPRWTGVFEDGSIGLVDFALDAIAAERPDFVLIAGDLINGRWGLSDDPLAVRQALVRQMGDRFLGGMLRELNDRDLKVYAAVGDHEVGDNPWSTTKIELVSTYKANFISHLHMPENGPEAFRGTTYSLRYEGVELFVIDEFEIHDGQMRVGATGTQIEWLDRAMAASTADFKFVVGHAPILPGFRARSSSGLQVTDGPDSDLWRVIVDQHADVYFCGEVHDVSFQKRDDVLQLITGTQPSNVSEFNYLVANVFRDRVDFEIKSIRTTIEGPRDASLDPYGKDKYTQRIVKVTPSQQATGWQTVGTMTLRRSAQGHTYDQREGLFESRWDDQDLLDLPNLDADAGM